MRKSDLDSDGVSYGIIKLRFEVLIADLPVEISLYQFTSRLIFNKGENVNEITRTFELSVDGGEIPNYSFNATISDPMNIKQPGQDINIQLNIEPESDSKGEATNCLASIYFSSYIEFVSVEYVNFTKATHNSTETKLKIVITLFI
jgi:hypothetical protein